MNNIVTLKNGASSAKISSLGAQLLSFCSEKTEYMWQADKNVWGFTAPVLFPICGSLNKGRYVFDGKVYEMTPHGFARFKEFGIENLSGNKACFLLKSDKDTKKKYPFDFEFRVSFSLFKNRLDITYCAKNTGNGDMYFSFGGHEGYSCPEGADEYYVKFENDTSLTRHMLQDGFFNGKTEKINLTDNVLSLDYGEFEKCTYIFKNINSDSVIFGHKNGKRKIRVGFPSHTSLALWTLPERKYVCIEPWCGVSEKQDFDGDITKKDGIICIKPFQSFERTHFAEILG